MVVLVLIVLNQATKFNRRDQGITDISLEVIPNDTTEIDFSLNEISVLPEEYFNLHLPDLEMINLGGNKLSVLADNWLSSLPSLERVYVYGNRLETIKNATFSGLFNVWRLWLNTNKIASVECGAFRDLQALSELQLFKNKLHTIHECIFDLESPPATLDMYLSENPWICSEELSWLFDERHNWITLKPWTGKYPQCSSPPDLVGCDLNILTTKQLQNTTTRSGQ